MSLWAIVRSDVFQTKGEFFLTKLITSRARRKYNDRYFSFQIVKCVGYDVNPIKWFFNFQPMDIKTKLAKKKN